jgi:hypothetical protein
MFADATIARDGVLHKNSESWVCLYGASRATGTHVLLLILYNLYIGPIEELHHRSQSRCLAAHDEIAGVSTLHKMDEESSTVTSERTYAITETSWTFT